MTPPRWKLPPGCTPGTWEYVRSDSIAADYDRYFASHDLMTFDEPYVADFLARHGEPGQRIADFGCGTGRVLLALAPRGFRGLGIDLSEKMLEQLKRKAADAGWRDDIIETAVGNWVDLHAMEDACVDHGVSLFSSLGMIHGRQHRLQALRETHRLLRPGGWFLLHVHNYWFNLYDAGGWWRVPRDLWRSLVRDDWERGDKYYRYRGVTQMFLHSFTAAEIRADLRQAGFQNVSLAPLRAQPHRLLPAGRCLPSLRAIGWMIAARKPQ